MDILLYWIARGLLAFIQALPLRVVARMGRVCGTLAYGVDLPHRRIALSNLRRCFPEKSMQELRAIARENFRRLGENFASAAKTASMDDSKLDGHLTISGLEKIQLRPDGTQPRSCVVAVGHFGNFELYARLNNRVPGFQGATTYRGLAQPSLERLLRELRERSGCRYFERRTQSDELRRAMREESLLLGLLADQHGGRSGVKLPFFGHVCYTSTAPALFALRYDAPLHTCICYRAGLANWRLEMGEEIPTHVDGVPRTLDAIMADVNAVFEAAIRRDPANWFWVHTRWKVLGPRRVRQRPQRNSSAAPDE